jgi:glutathione S-transferase
MLKVYVFGPRFGLPDPSSFCIKALVLLKQSGLPFETVTGDVRKAPKGKFPVLEDDGIKIPDSTFIRWHLEQRHGIDFDKGLTNEQKAIAWAFEKLCEDNLYWAIVHDRWMNDENFNKGPRQFFEMAPAPLRALVTAMVRRDVKRTLHGQGLGRHSKADVDRLAAQGLTAISDYLGDKPFFMGDRPTGIDASIFACVSSCLCELFPGANYDAVRAHNNLVAYRDRCMTLWFRDAGAAA